MNRKIWKNIALILVFIIAVFFLINQFTENTVSENIKSIKIAGQNIKVELVISEKAQTKGLSEREKLEENTGMLFVFENPNKYSFWMKDMKFPIDIIWLAPLEGGNREEVKVVYIKKDARPESYPETFEPEDVPTQFGIPTSVGTKYVLEVLSGFSEKNNLKVGEKEIFEY
jgi:hypothetical protein